MNKNVLNHNRLKELRLKNKKTQKDLAKLLNVSEQAIAYYEQALREPKIETWDKLANYFNVPTSYLMGLSNDVDGWDEWAKNTGYSVKQIKEEIARLKETNRLDGDSSIQHQISEAVKSLDNSSYSTTQGVQHELIFQLTNLISKVDDAFLEPHEVNYGSITKLMNTGKVRKDMDEKAYHEMINALTEAKNKIGQISIRSKYL